MEKNSPSLQAPEVTPQAPAAGPAWVDFHRSLLQEAAAIEWAAVEMGLRTFPRAFDATLAKVHFRRKKPMTAALRERIRRFLATGYGATGDVRYFNELLWYDSKEAPDEYTAGCREQFLSSVDHQGVHPFPGVSREEAQAFLTQHGAPAECRPDTTEKVCLIGFPPFFGKIHRELTRAGFTVEQYFIPHHPNRKVRLLLSQPALVKGISLLKGNRQPYQTLRCRHTDPQITPVLQERNFSIGFHKINGILKKNLIDGFRKGLINDHWGLLPFLRGKSTIAWTVLFGFPMAATLHLIDEGVDTGRIIGFAPCATTGLHSLSAIRNRLRATLPERVVAAVRQLSDPGFSFIENTPEKGRTFYEMHPWLEQYVERNLLA
ncbi:MAG TPA: formyltransferase family protein [Chitinophagaceae bacterium]|nr:formyltransferase family protein [Chitinophagaceae bacterium]